MKKLVCDQCGKEITSPGDIDLVLKGTDAWQNAVRDRGEEPRGIFPCENYVRCCGEMIIVDTKADSESLADKVKGLFKKNKII